MSSLRFLRQAVARSTRTFSSSASSRADIIKDIYIKEIKSYKPPPAAKDAHLGAVKTLTTPQPPKPPVLPADLASELAAYDAAEPTKVDEPAGKGAVAEDVGQGAEAFLTFLEADVKPAEGHH